MNTLALLLPPLRRIADSKRLTTLVNWLTRGDHLPDAKPGRDVAVRECFHFIGTSTPVAALTRSLDADDAGGSSWLRADPAWVTADAVTLRMLACGNMDLSSDDSERLASALRPLFGDAGFPLEPATPARWYLRCPHGAKLPAFADPDDVLGDDLAHHMPEGVEGKRWRQLLNEVQIILHNHPVNAERAQRGQAPVNSLWFWGAGRLPDWVRTNFLQVLSDDPLIAALARAAGIRCSALQNEVSTQIESKGALLVDLARLRDATSLEKNWLTAIDRILREGHIREIHCLFDDGQRLRVKASHRWRFWRHRRLLITT